MAVTNLGQLRTLVKDWSNRTDISDTTFDSFINLAQERANRVLRIPVLEGYQSLTITSEGTINLPTDYLEAKALSVSVGGRTYDLERKDLPLVVGKQTDSGFPKYFARQQNRFFVAPINNAVNQADLYYYIALNPLVNDTDSNWFVEYGTDLLLYGALAELSLYTKNPEEAAAFEGKFRGAAAEIENMANKAEFSGSTLGIRPKR
jgi:hypothetical protein